MWEVGYSHADDLSKTMMLQEKMKMFEPTLDQLQYRKDELDGSLL
jgi:hypothetical protein